MSIIKFTRIKNRLNEIYDGKIYDDDIKNSKTTKEYQDKWNSRAYTAYAINMIGEEEEASETDKYVTDGFNDNGIDAIYDDKENKKLVFIQTKFSNSSSIELGDVEKFIKGVHKIMTLKFDGFNDRILQRRSEVEPLLYNFDYNIELLIVLGSNQKISTHVESSLNEFIQKINDDDGLISYNVIYFNDVYNHMADSTVGDKVTINNFYLENYGMLKNEDGPSVYYGVTPAENIAKMKDEFGNRVLQKNIRYFKKDTDVNNGIIKVLNNEPHNFYLYNNGIKIIAEKIEKAPIGSGDRNVAILKLEGVSIINGAQTTGCLHEVYREDREKLQNVKIQVQLISLQDLEEEMSDKITRLSNTQNKIENKDFAVQDPVQEQLKRDLAIDGYTYIYKQGENDSAFTSENSCDIDEATISLGCALDDVNISTNIKRAYGSIFDDITKPPYKLIFNNGVSPYKLWNAILVYRELQKIESDFQKDPEKLDKRLLSVHGNRMILHLVLKTIIRDNPHFMTQYLKNVDDFNLNILYENLMTDLLAVKTELYQDAYPAYIFKNSKKCKELSEKMLEKDSLKAM